MASLNDLLAQTYRPKLAVVVYESNLSSADEKYYLESHDFLPTGELGAGRPLMQQTLQGIVDVFFDENQNKSKIGGFIPESILSFTPQPGGHYSLVWYREPEKRVIHFAKELKIKSGQIWTPSMIYQVERKDLNVYAFVSPKRPSPATKLFRAPFHNVGDRGHVCLGSAQVEKPKEKTFDAITKYWEDLFWLSEFSHLNGASNPTKSPLEKVWSRLVASKLRLKWSALDELKPIPGLTLKNLLK